MALGNREFIAEWKLIGKIKISALEFDCGSMLNFLALEKTCFFLNNYKQLDLISLYAIIEWLKDRVKCFRFQ